jgi:deoxycytidine triphosphate deaminase
MSMVEEAIGAGTGSLLTGSDLYAALDGKVFVPGSWDAENVRAAGYDLRLSAEEMIAPVGRHGWETRYFGGKNPRQLPLVLEPGQTAVVSSEERLCCDFDIAGNIGMKFRLAAQGLLVLTGMAIDPGYGRKLDTTTDEWIAMTDQRLHFVLANVGASQIVLVPGKEKIAFLQLFKVEMSASRETPSQGWNVLTQALFESSTGEKLVPGGLAYFKNVRDLQDRVDEIERVSQTVASTVDKVEKASNYVVVFGVFLVAVTILGFVLNSLFTAIEKLPAHPTQTQNLLIYSAVGAYGIGVLLLVWLAVKRIR